MGHRGRRCPLERLAATANVEANEHARASVNSKASTLSILGYSENAKTFHFVILRSRRGASFPRASRP